MKPARDAAALFAHPYQRYLARRRFAYACVDPTLSAVIGWGRIEEPDALELIEALRAEEAAAGPPHRSLLHFQHVQSADEATVRLLSTYMAEHEAQQAQVISREAVVRPEGTVGMMVAGFYEVVSPPYPVAVFSTAAEALDWLGAPSALAEIDEVLAIAREEAGLVQSLRELLLRERLDMTTAAQRLGMSERTLQRRLLEAGLSFREEQAAARLRLAQELLVSQPQLDIKVVAAEAGFASTQSFCTAFRQAIGVTAAEWREKHRVRR